MNLTKTIIFGLMLLSLDALGQGKIDKNNLISLTAKNWDFQPESVEFLNYKNRPAMKILTSNDQVILKDFQFDSGTIEYDMEPLDQRFTSIYFRWNGLKENECFYFRTSNAGNPQAIDAIQYAPHIDGVNLWDMLFHFQSNADFKKDEWNHVKLVIAGKQMRVYVNDMNHAALEVPHLEGNPSTGTLAFDGQVIISNLVVKPNLIEGLSSNPGMDPTTNDVKYLRKWVVSEPITMAQGIDFRNEYYPDSATKWQPIIAERRGLINLTRKFGQADGRRIVWLKTTIRSTKNQEVKLHLGFSDEVWVFINNRFLYVDKNLYGAPIMKQPDGRCTIENTSFNIPLTEGENELLIGVGNFFYGWGIVARLNKLTDLTVEN